MTTTLKIDFVSDVSCPWCIIGLKALEQAAERLQGEVALDLHFQPFELNPQMGPEGQDIGEHLQEEVRRHARAKPEEPRSHRRARGRSWGLPSAWTSAAASTTPLTHTACCTGPRNRARRTR